MFTRSKLVSLLILIGSLVASPILAFGDGCSAACPGTITCTGTFDAADVTDAAKRPDSAGTLNGPPGTCAVPDGCIINPTTDFPYDTYFFTNNTGGGSPDCFSVTLDNTCVNTFSQNIFAVAYSPSYVLGAGNQCTNYVNQGVPVQNADPPQLFSFNLINGATVMIVIFKTGNSVCTTGGYSFTITPCGSLPSAANGVVSGRILTNDQSPISGTVVSLSGTQSRKTITDANGNYQFDNVETNGFYTVTPSRVNYSFSPAERSFSQLGNSTEAAFTAVPSDDGVNPLDTPEYFVRQHYLDFLGREPDESGFNFWSDQMLECGGDAGCLERRRINVSAAYFLSIEFQQTGGLVDGLYRASYGVRPQFAEFMPDTAAIAHNVVVGRTGWEQQLDANKQAFVDAWVERPSFRAAYDLVTNDRYVDSLIAHTGVGFTPSERDTLVNGLTFGTLSRAGALQRIAEDQRFVAAKRNEAFVMMQYFAYLRRDPDESGYQFWLNKLNQFGGNFEQAEMVKAFIVSDEYRARFR